RGVLVGGAMDAPFQVTDRPRGQPRRLRQLLLGQLRLGPQLPQQPREPQPRPLRHRPSAPQNPARVTGPPGPSSRLTPTQPPSPPPTPPAPAGPAPLVPRPPSWSCRSSCGPSRVVNLRAAGDGGTSCDTQPPPS